MSQVAAAHRARRSRETEAEFPAGCRVGRRERCASPRRSRRPEGVAERHRVSASAMVTTVICSVRVGPQPRVVLAQRLPRRRRAGRPPRGRRCSRGRRPVEGARHAAAVGRDVKGSTSSSPSERTCRRCLVARGETDESSARPRRQSCRHRHDDARRRQRGRRRRRLFCMSAPAARTAGADAEVGRARREGHERPSDGGDDDVGGVDDPHDETSSRRSTRPSSRPPGRPPRRRTGRRRRA